MKLPKSSQSKHPARKNRGVSRFAQSRKGTRQGWVFQAVWISARQLGTPSYALRTHVSDHEVARVDDTQWGTSYVVEGLLKTPDGRNPRVRAIWFVDRGTEAPRFITAYPLRKRKR